jgi:hypothetical protein
MNESYDDTAGRGQDAEFNQDQGHYESQQGRRFEQDPPRRRRHGEYKSTVAAAFLSMLLAFAGIITLLASGDLRGLEPLFGIFLSFFWIYNLVDAMRLAQAYNNAVDAGLTSAEPIKVSGSYGRGAGIGLIVVGTLIFLETRFDMDMRWLEEYWPLAIIGVGDWIVRSSMQRKAAEEAEG